MTKLPEFLRSRLALLQSQSSEHPNAGLLAEFAQRTLPARERAGLLEHLARCLECREVLAAASTPEVTKAPGIAWWKWRWAVAAAAACLVAALFWRPGSLQNSSWNAVPSPPAAPAAPREKEPMAIGKQPARKQIVSHRDTTKQSIAKAELPPPPQFVAAQPEPPPALPETMNVPSRESAPPPPQLQKSAAIEPQRDRARLEAPSMTFESGLRAGAAKALARRTSRPERGNSRWNLDGTLRKSEDGGKSWRTVPVDDRAQLYALSAAGSNVWVGGANGALFHSVDDGLEWKPVFVAGLTDTITRIEARDENWVKLTTRSGNWLTTDAGAHWRRE